MIRGKFIETMSVQGDHEILEHYYENLEKNSRFHCYERKDSEACHNLGDFLETKKKKYKDALEVFKENCFKREYGDSCFRYGQMFYLAKGVEKDIVEAYKAHEKGCKVKKYNGGSCDTIGMQYMSETVLPEIAKIRGKRNVKRAVELFVKGCEGKDPLACGHAALAYKNGIEGHVKPNPELAFKYGVKACDYRNRDGCQIVAEAYRTGVGTEKNDALYEYYSKQAKFLAHGNLTALHEQKQKEKEKVLQAIKGEK